LTNIGGTLDAGGLTGLAEYRTLRVVAVNVSSGSHADANDRQVSGKLEPAISGQMSAKSGHPVPW